jgi:hypothetical protein
MSESVGMKSPERWQGWWLIADFHGEPVLRHDALPDDVRPGGRIYLLTCTTSARMLDKIMTVAHMRVAFEVGDQPLLGLIAAVEDIFFPQVNLCTEGSSKRLTERQIRELTIFNCGGYGSGSSGSAAVCQKHEVSRWWRAGCTGAGAPGAAAVRGCGVDRGGRQ